MQALDARSPITGEIATGTGTDATAVFCTSAGESLRYTGKHTRFGEYAARLVKKSVVGVGNASKDQVHAMVQRLLPGARIAGPDAADALAVAITHAHHLASARRIPRG